MNESGSIDADTYGSAGSVVTADGGTVDGGTYDGGTYDAGAGVGTGTAWGTAVW
jgi:hypothetical protein